ncbi:hypothetical protein [Streptomyces sp. NPDC051704]|uniref:hypothetical protein n=1 Tax=Streptomyces sp. NPDC051704 TaxID=3365671 RepID=UPI0037ACBD51
MTEEDPYPPPAPPAPAHHPAIGDTVRDTHSHRIGIVTSLLGPHVRLRPLLGGPGWDADPAQLTPVGPAEVLSARVAEVNERSRRASPDPPVWPRPAPGAHRTPPDVSDR